jgi:D-sedoheptulose 7-phosphate isomerase
VTRAALVARYLGELRESLTALEREPLDAAIDVLQTARAERRTVFVFGNGGSAATAVHVACDLAKNTRSHGRPGLRMVCLAVDAASLTAYANDEGYDASFAEQLRTLARAGDVAIAISASGTSPNVLRALEAAREIGLRTIGLTGPDGGKIPALVDVCLHAASPQIEHIEDVHLVINHLLTVVLREGDAAG